MVSSISFFCLLNHIIRPFYLIGLANRNRVIHQTSQCLNLLIFWTLNSTDFINCTIFTFWKTDPEPRSSVSVDFISASTVHAAERFAVLHSIVGAVPESLRPNQCCHLANKTDSIQSAIFILSWSRAQPKSNLLVLRSRPSLQKVIKILFITFWVS